MVIMTSNLGSREMSELVSGGMGFAPGKGATPQNDSDVDQKIYRTAVDAARRKFSPEFMNRIDKVVVFRSLKEDHLREILDIELQAVQERVINSAGTKFLFQCSDPVKDTLLREGLDPRYGARHLKRSVERFLVSPLSNLVASKQVGFGDLIYIDVHSETGRFTFSKRPGSSSVCDAADLTIEPENDEPPCGGVGILLPQTQAANMFVN
jgi:ATP-dependent Clp protease ATP-binding subunit ClpA